MLRPASAPRPASPAAEPLAAGPPAAPALSPGERRWRWAIIGVLLLFVAWPYLWLAWTPPPGHEYGGLLFNADDQNVHLAWARQAAQGHFFFRNLFTTEGLDAPSSWHLPFTNLFCWLAGALAALTRTPLIVVYHALRLLFAALALVWFSDLCALLTPDRRVRLLALALAAFAGGAGWLADLFPHQLAGHAWMDRPAAMSPLAGPRAFPMMPEAFTVTSALLFPLFIAATAGLPLIYGLALRAARAACLRTSLRPALGASVVALLLGNVHPYDVPPLLATLLLWTALRRGTPNAPNAAPAAYAGLRWPALLLISIGALAPVAWQGLALRGSEFSGALQAEAGAPPLGDVLLSYGLLVPLAVIGAVQSWRSEARLSEARLMVWWALVPLALIYAPLSFARKMIEGVHLPLCFLAAVGLVWLCQRLPWRPARWLLAGGVWAAMSLSPLQFIVWRLADAHRPERDVFSVRAPIYLSQSDAAALRFLDSLPPSDKARAVLCLPFVGSYVPRLTGLPVYAGHWAYTLDAKTKLGIAGAFFSGRMPLAQAHALLHEAHIGYVLEGSREKLLRQVQGGVQGGVQSGVQGGASAPSPAQTLNLTKIYDRDGATIYRVPEM